MKKIKCFNCEKEMDVVGVSLEDLFKAGLTMFCSQECAGAFPHYGTDAFSERLEVCKRKFLAYMFAEPLCGKLCRMEGAPDGADGPLLYFKAVDVRAAAQWLKEKIAQSDPVDEGLLSAIDEAFKDVNNEE